MLTIADLRSSQDSSAQDPVSPSNDDPNGNDDLLKPNNSGGPSSDASTLTPLTMGVTLSSPTPVISADIIPAFKYDTYFIRDAGDVNFPAPHDADAAWYPRPPPDANDDGWEAVRSQWAGPPGLGEGAAQTAVGLWAALSFARWEVEAKPGDISGRAPVDILLKKDTNTFQTLYLEAPRMAAVAA